MTTQYPKASIPAVRQHNSATIFQAIYESAPTARVNIARQTGLNDRTVSLIVDKLITHGLVREIGYRPSRTGRKARELEIDPSARYAIGVDIHRHGATAALVDLAGHIHRQIQQPPADLPQDIEHILPTATQAAHQLLTTITPEQHAKTVGIGIGAPGRFTAKDGHYFGSFGLNRIEWTDLGPTTQVDEQLQRPTYLDNNANTSALAELWFGQGRGSTDFVVLNLSTGIGMGIVVNGDLYRGGNQYAGEASHITVNLDGLRTDDYGSPGCLHQYASGRALLQNVRTLLASGVPTKLRDHPNLSINDIINAYHSGDELATEIFTNLARHLAAALASIISTIDPQLILIGRDIAAAGEPFFTNLRTEVRKRLNSPTRDEIRIEPTDVPDAPIIGAATLALREFFRAPLTPLPA